MDYEDGYSQLEVVYDFRFDFLDFDTSCDLSLYISLLYYVRKPLSNMLGMRGPTWQKYFS